MRALIVGGGVAGAAAAVTLRRIGWDPVVFEAYGRSAHDVGAYLFLASNGLNALDSFGMKDEIVRRGLDMRSVVAYSHAGRRLGASPFGRHRADATPTQMIDRSDLYGALLEEAQRQGVPVEYGKRFVDLKETADGVRVFFEDGGSADGDVVIGADGVWSRVRETVDPGGPALSPTCIVGVGGRSGALDVPGEPGDFQTFFGTQAFFGYVRQPDGTVQWLATPAIDTPEAAVALAALPAEQWRKELLRMLEVDRTPAPRIVAATVESYPPSVAHSLPNGRPWFTDRVVLLGDAAHPVRPSIGQGASMALEDAATLARCLRDTPDLRGAFDRYDRVRRERIEQVIKIGVDMDTRMRMNSRTEVFVRNLAVSVVLWHEGRTIRRKGELAGGDMAALWGHHIDWEQPVTA
ncbi:FAD-dependent oxidoreductase [Micromonospora sp. NPDC048935]|uniref:FAD-dependent oxidoreductase n=1 Tax=Micromonospora sp. NPDC048935 TaxID=3364262 RepID=UPI0037223005